MARRPDTRPREWRAGPSPDGRKAISALTDGSLSPGAGKDRHGPTAVLNSAAKIPFMHTELFNQRFMPVCLEKENRPLFAAYLREWYEKGTTPHIQFNVVNDAVLRNARTPENYQDLQVRRGRLQRVLDRLTQGHPRQHHRPNRTPLVVPRLAIP